MSHPTPEERRLAGRERRAASTRSSHGAWRAPDGRADPIAVLERQGETRVPELLPIRYGRMAASPFAFLRGAAAVMAADIAAAAPPTGLRVQLCGDAHLSNFGLFASPERRLVFDLNDFDETLPGPFEYDVKRLTASLAVAARDKGEAPRAAAEAARAAARRYREAMLSFARMRHLEVWYAHADVDAVLATQATISKLADRDIAKARRRTNLQAFAKLTETVDGVARFRDDPPLIEHLPQLEHGDLAALVRAYRDTLPDERRVLFDRYELVDVARKVVGVGSVGTRAFILLLTGRDAGDPLILQAKEACPSVLEPHTGRSRYRQEGKRVVVGQRLMQTASGLFLGWLRGPGGRDFYVRQLRDMKGAAEIERMSLAELTLYGELCGWVLARAHARTGDAAAIAGYLGGGEAFDKAMRDWADTYADQTQRDHEALLRAIDAGRLAADPR